jgi:hypothetical protein
MRPKCAIRACMAGRDHGGLVMMTAAASDQILSIGP